MHVTNDSIIWTAVNAIKELYGQFKALVTRVINLESKDIAKDRAIASIKAQAATLEIENTKLKQENADIKARLEKIENLVSPHKKI